MIAQVFEKQFHNQTTTHTVGLIAVYLLGAALMLLPRKHAIIPVLLMASVLPIAQRIVIVGLDFNFIRILVLCGWLRVLLRSEVGELRWHWMDLLLTLWTVSRIATYTILHDSMAAFVFRLGSSFDSIGLYFLFRVFIRTWEDVYRLAKVFVAISVPMAALFLIERFTQRNLLSFLGDVPEVTRERNGRLRCQGPYTHPILAGCFWASLLPLMAARYWRREAGKTSAIVGLISGSIIIVNCASSTPVASTFAGFVGMLFFPLRRNMRLIRWGVLAMLLMLHLTMNKPVWHLISRIDLAGGSTGWHRFHLIDQTIKNFQEWWLIGVVSTAHWGHMMFDVTNQYVLEGVRGGLITLVLFVGMLAVSYGRVGTLWRSAHRDRRLAILSWSLGVMLFVHCINFLAVAYYGQITVLLYLTLAMISSTPALQPVGARRRRPSIVRDRLPVPAGAR